MKKMILAAALALGTSTAFAQTPGTQIYAVVHVDIQPDLVSKALPILRTYVQHAAADNADVAHIDLLQQSNAPNHFTLIEVLRSQAAYNRFVAQPFARDMRFSIQPLLGGPFDERLHVQAMP